MTLKMNGYIPKTDMEIKSSIKNTSWRWRNDTKGTRNNSCSNNHNTRDIHTAMPNKSHHKRIEEIKWHKGECLIKQ